LRDIFFWAIQKYIYQNVKSLKWADNNEHGKQNMKFRLAVITTIIIRHVAHRRSANLLQIATAFQDDFSFSFIITILCGLYLHIDTAAVLYSL